MTFPQKNPRIPEGINNPAAHPLRELIFLGSGLCILLLLTAVLIWTMFTHFAQWIPVRWEARIAPDISTPAEYQASRQQLQARLDQLLTAMNTASPSTAFDPGVSIELNMMKSDEANAFATLGPQIFVTTALLDEVHSQIGLDMVLAHEAAHIVHRDPIRTLAGTLGVQLLMSMVTGNTQVATLSGSGSQLLLLRYSREQETAADELALKTLWRVHGTLSGADEFFQQILNKDNHRLPTFLLSHPHPQARIEHIRQMMQQYDF
ncbi:TPR repeat-containing protein YfgC precursor [Vibrio aerogenes CECT 7868]|uniref:TPR repeat-containing protein YfgC n=1 Tax=Vibrio aerogenes CECT 7868 TaxID=1216006 RepID=A0A1M5Z4Z1_9VIBR|nr:M48 family metallopeptidase [Vibrio aerogenes]SHI19251.1 TPR repeat-containing protein YfgC precursor [Vibrio aerogenes CECT 7868]